MSVKIRKHARINPEKTDGYRLLVTRYWLRGLSKTKISEWDKNLAPSIPLLASWCDQKMDEMTPSQKKLFHQDWCREYRREMRQQKERIEELRRRHIEGETITLLCACHDTEFCHRTELKEIIENGWADGC